MSTFFIRIATPLAFLGMHFGQLSGRRLPGLKKPTADDIGSFTAVCVVRVLCEYRQSFGLVMCDSVSFLT